jgi:hypothetical protein
VTDTVARGASEAARAVALADALERVDLRLGTAVDALVAAELDALSGFESLRDRLGSLARSSGRPLVAGAPARPVRAPVHEAPAEAHPALRDARRLEADRVRAGRRAAPPVAVKTAGARTERQIAYVVSFALFLAVGWIAARSTGALPGDAISRVQAAQSVVFGRDPHLEAMGFIWGPFPTFFQVPFVWLRQWWLPMTGDALAAVIVSALFMAGVVTQLLRWGEEAGARWAMRLAVALVTVAHPLIWLFGANGMSEACWLFFLVVAARRLALWAETDDLRHLGVVGASIGCAYLVRYESAAVLMAVVAYVGATTFSRWHPRMDDSAFGEPRWEHDRERLQRTVLDVTLVALPAAACMAMWAFASWAIIGEPFPQFTSEYGNSALVRAARDTLNLVVPDYSSLGRAWFYVVQLAVAAPGLVLVAVLSLASSRSSTGRITAALVVLGAPLGVQLVFSYQGSTFPWFRYTIAGVVLAAMLALSLGRAGAGLRTLAVAALVPGVILSTALTWNGGYGNVDTGNTQPALAALGEGRSEKDETLLGAGAAVAADIDDMADVNPGAVLCDATSCFSVLINAPRPDVYVIPADRDFLPLVSDPARFGVRYLLTLSPEAANVDAVKAEHPGLWDGTGTPVARQIREWGDESEPRTHWRLFQVIDPEGEPSPRPDEELTG